MRSALACGGRMANDALADLPRQCGPFQLAEPTSAEMAYNPSIGYFRQLCVSLWGADGE